jgi:hypothetical protein
VWCDHSRIVSHGCACVNVDVPRYGQHAEQRVENKRKDARWHTGSHALRYADDEQQQQCRNAPDKLAARAERLQHTITPARAAIP